MHKSNPIKIFFLLLSLACLVFAYLNYPCARKFNNPIGFTFSKGIFFVLEKEGNTILEFKSPRPGRSLRIMNSFRTRSDDNNYFYMARVLFPSPMGIMVKSVIYDRNSGDSCGYSFEEYSVFEKDVPPVEILRVLFGTSEDYPEFSYACDKDGNHYFINNMPRHKNIWKIAASGSAFVDRGICPANIREMGEENSDMSSWMNICIGEDGTIYASNGATGRITTYSSEGVKTGEIGRNGFAEDELLAPQDLFFLKTTGQSDELLTVANTGHRNWIQFDKEGKVSGLISPLLTGYPFEDILVGRIYPDYPAGITYTFDLVNKAFIMNAYQLKTSSSFTGMFSAGPATKGGEHVVTSYSKRFGICVLIPLVLCPLFIFCALFSGILSFLVRKIRIPFFVKLLLVFIPLIVLSSLVVASLAEGIVKTDLEEETVRRCANLARAVVNSISVDDLEKIQDPGDRNSATYEKIHRTISSIIDSKSVEKTPKWILHKIRDARYYFGINIWKGPIYEPFIISKDKKIFYDVLKDKECRWGRYSDSQGEWMSYLMPVTGKSGTLIYVLELYRPTEEIDRSKSLVAAKVQNSVIIIVILAAFIMLVFSYLFTIPLKKLIKSTRIIGDGDFEHRIKIDTRDEIGELASSFNGMVEKIRQKVSNLSISTSENIGKDEPSSQTAHDKIQAAIPSPVPGIDLHAVVQPGAGIDGHYSIDLASDYVLMKYASAEYPFSFVIRDGKLSRIPSCEGEKCGMDNEVSKSSGGELGSIKILPGETIILVNEGLVSATDPYGENFGIERFISTLEKSVSGTSREISARILDELAKFQKGRTPAENIAFIVIVFPPATSA